MGGIGVAAKILNRIDRDTVKSILSEIGSVDAELAQTRHILTLAEKRTEQ